MRKQPWLWVTAGAGAVALALVATLGVAIALGAGPTGWRYRSWMGTNQPTVSDCALAAAAGTLVTFTARDMGGSMMSGWTGPMTFIPRQASAPAGEVTIELRNLGSRPHELLIFPLAANQQPGARSLGADDRVSEEGAIGEVQPVCPGEPGMDGTPVGGISRVTLNLKSGRYEILCNLPGHYRHGMSALLTIS